jgi:hypothetical protein
MGTTSITPDCLRVLRGVPISATDDYAQALDSQCNDPADDPFGAELYARYVAGEITVEEAYVHADAG